MATHEVPAVESLSHSCLSDVKVWLSVDGKPLALRNKTSSSYPAKVNFYDGRKAFKYPFDLNFYLDGNHVAYCYEKRKPSYISASQGSRDRLKRFGSQRIGATEGRPFVFGRIQTTDDKSKALPSEKVQQVGTVAVEFRRIKFLKEFNLPGAANPNYADFKEDAPVDEAEKKFVLSAKLGESRAIPFASGTSATYEWRDKSPRITYTFHKSRADDRPVANSLKRARAEIDLEGDDGDQGGDDDDELLATIEAQQKVLAERAARVRAKKDAVRDVKPRITPPSPRHRPEQFEPFIDMGKRLYVDYDEKDALREEKREIAKEKEQKREVLWL
ncbi:hypothetical protein JCM11491_005001 [Sporobolomyces phaffii]